MSTAGAFFLPPSPNMLALLPMHPAGFTPPWVIRFAPLLSPCMAQQRCRVS